MMRLILIKSLCYILVIVSLSAAAFAAETDRITNEFKRGEAVFIANCARCHGVKGVGTDNGPPLLHKTYHPNHHADISFYRAVEQGVRAHHWPYGDMPKIEGVSRIDTGYIIYYIRSIQKEAGIF
ncbi:MAG: hypothetical protein A3J24_02530 [Deltaproteobacteria bacterium RIFCSPLOWO2_02_FULL_53_8]|nr:MAG: hypothetical protein A3J24_02530 [Deltaproteobacteria bacterium RIFCSPLOWO2_02_FULL_53_8]